jgi:hypothetical protein
MLRSATIFVVGAVLTWLSVTLTGNQKPTNAAMLVYLAGGACLFYGFFSFFYFAKVRGRARRLNDIQDARDKLRRRSRRTLKS